MKNKQTRQDIILWHLASAQMSSKYGNMCKCGSILTAEHALECRMYRAELSRRFFQLTQLKTKKNAISKFEEMYTYREHELLYMKPEVQEVCRRSIQEELSALELAINALR